MTANGVPEIVPDLIRAHVQYIHCLAGSLVGQGKVIVAGFGEDPTQPDLKTGKLGRRLSPRVLHSVVGDMKQTLIDIRQILKLRHYNVYMPLAIFRPNLREGGKGYVRDVIACLGIVADFDDPEAPRWAHRLPMAPNYVIETSAGRFQAFFLFDKPEALDVVKPVAERLKVFAKCDHGTSDMSHVWRVPGALNWPNAKKVGEGRALDPQLVRVAKPWDLGTISLQALSDALPEVEPSVTPKKTMASAPKNKTDTGGGRSLHRAAVDGSLENLTALVELQALPPELQEEIKQAATGDRSKALFRVIGKMLEAGLDDLAIETIIEAHPKGIGEKYAGRKDLDKEIARVKAKMAAPPQDDKVTSMISQMNREYAVVDDDGNTVVVYRREDTELNRKYVVRASYRSFREFHLNARTLITDPASGKVKWLANADIWLAHVERRTYKEGLRFLPGVSEVSTDIYNLWTGWGVEPQPGDWSKMKAHIQAVLCSDIPEHFNYIMNWMARAVQEPSVAGEVALVLRGDRGTGKGIFARAMGALFGQHFLHLSDARHLTGNFNAHLRDACLVFADEAFYAGDKQHEGQLKRLVTEPTLMIEAKYANAVSVRNCLHLIVASNEGWVVPAGTDERRFFVLDVSSIRKKDYEYFKSLQDELKNGGAAGMLYELLHRDISNFNVHEVPQTSGLLDQKVHSLRGLEAWWFEILSDGTCPGMVSDEGIFVSEESDWVDQIKVDRNSMYENYEAFSKSKKEYRAESKSQLGKFLRRYVPGLTEERPRQVGNGRRDRLYRLPSLIDCRVAFEKVVGAVKWEDA